MDVWVTTPRGYRVNTRSLGAMKLLEGKGREAGNWVIHAMVDGRWAILDAGNGYGGGQRLRELEQMRVNAN